MEEMKVESNTAATPAKRPRGRPRKSPPDIPHSSDIKEFVVIDKNVVFRDVKKELAETPALDTKSESNGERETRRILEQRLGVKFKSIRPSILVNNATKKNLELDGYSTEFHIGFEYNGIQHEEAGHFGMTKEVFDKQTERDKLKYMRLLQYGVRCIILENTPLDKLEDEIAKQLWYIDQELYEKYVSWKPPEEHHHHNVVGRVFGFIAKKLVSIFTKKPDAIETPILPGSNSI